jgi:outer membrane protein
MQGVLVGTKDGQKASQELTARFEPKQKEIQGRRTELVQLEDQFNKGAAVMSDDKKAQLARDLDEKKKRLERDSQDAEEEVQGEQQHILQALGQRAMAVVDKFAKDNGYNLIVDDGNPSTPILYASAAMDITQEIVALYDKTYANNPLPASAPSQATPKTGQAIPGIPR